MPPASPDPEREAALREAAANWYARMRGPDAERYRAAFEEWLGAASAHGSAYERIALRWDQSALVGHTPSGQARDGLPEAQPRSPASRYFALAAGLVAVISLGTFFLVSPEERSASVPTAVMARQELSAPVGAVRRMRLGDGSIVTLDTATRLELAFSASERRLRLLAGRARFEVAHDAARAFIVAVGGGEVIATGTVFDVSLIGDRPRIHLIEGAVIVRDRPGTSVAPARTARLTPGQAIAIGGSEAAPVRVPASEARWASGMLVFDATPLSTAVAEANRYSNREIRLAPGVAGELPVTGGFKAGDQDAIAGALAAALGLKVGRTGDALVLTR